MSWTINLLTLFPEMFPGPLGQSLAGKALAKNIWSLHVGDIRGYALDKHKTVDDICFGGGAGMVLRPDVMGEAIDAIPQEKRGKILYFSPRGMPLTQKKVKKMVETPILTLICGRYEGIDERVLEYYDIEEVSIGDYILSGGEIAAFAFLDACVRLLPGVMGSKQSLEEESFENGLLEYPHYTRPREWRGLQVPPVLTQGNHGSIQQWRKAQSQAITRARRKDLWQAFCNKEGEE